MIIINTFQMAVKTGQPVRRLFKEVCFKIWLKNRKRVNISYADMEHVSQKKCLKKTKSSASHSSLKN